MPWIFILTIETRTRIDPFLLTRGSGVLRLQTNPLQVQADGIVGTQLAHSQVRAGPWIGMGRLSSHVEDPFPRDGKGDLRWRNRLGVRPLHAVLCRILIKHVFHVLFEFLVYLELEFVALILRRIQLGNPITIILNPVFHGSYCKVRH